jgi:hypothetical protein
MRLKRILFSLAGFATGSAFGFVVVKYNPDVANGVVLPVACLCLIGVITTYLSGRLDEWMNSPDFW